MAQSGKKVLSVQPKDLGSNLRTPPPKKGPGIVYAYYFNPWGWGGCVEKAIIPRTDSLSRQSVISICEIAANEAHGCHS